MNTRIKPIAEILVLLSPRSYFFCWNELTETKWRMFLPGGIKKINNIHDISFIYGVFVLKAAINICNAWFSLGVVVVLIVW